MSDDSLFSFSPLEFDTDRRNVFYEIAMKKDATKPIGADYYIYNIYESLFRPVELEIDTKLSNIKDPEPLPSVSNFFAKEAPSFVYDLALDPRSDFNGLIANAIVGGGISLKDLVYGKGVDPNTLNDPNLNKNYQTLVELNGGQDYLPAKTETDVVNLVNFVMNEPSLIGKGIDVSGDTALAYRTYGKNTWLANQTTTAKWNEAKAKYESDLQASKAARDKVYSDMGYPSPDLRYDPRTVKGYDAWEAGKVREFTTKMRREPTAAEINQLRKMASDIYHKQGYSPFYDAILRARAGS